MTAATPVSYGAIQTILVVDDDEQIGEGIAAALEKAGRHIIVCRDIESAELVLERIPIGYVLTDMKFSGEFGFEGLDFIEIVKDRPDSPVVILMTGHATDSVRAEARARGATAVLQKPFDLAAVEALVPRPSGVQEARITTVPPIDEVIASGRLLPVFQPLFRTDDQKGVAGCEALTRLETDSVFADPAVLFRYANMKHRVVDLETKTAGHAIRTGRELVRFGFLSINVHPHVFIEGEKFASSLMRTAADSALPPDRLVVEITEQGPLPDGSGVEKVVRELAAAGVRFAFDDVGSAYSHLRHIDLIRPAFLKISQLFGTGCEDNQTHRKIVENVCGLASAFGTEVVLEGVETEETARFASAAGIPIAQGYYYARPSPVSQLMAQLS